MQQRCGMFERATLHRPKARPPWRKRYGWYRLYDGFWRHPKWKVAARLAGGIHVTAAICVVGTLLECANKGKPRGCVEDYSFEEAAASLDLETQDVERIYGALEGLGWIDQEHLVEWDERQPDDPTQAVRSARYRDKRDAKRNAKGDARDRNAQRQRAYPLRKKAKGLGPDERVTRYATLKTQTSKKETGAVSLATGETVTWNSHRIISI